MVERAGAVPSVESQLASDRRMYGASFHRVVDGQKVRVPPWEVVITEGGVLVHNGQAGGIEEQIATASEVADG